MKRIHAALAGFVLLMTFSFAIMNTASSPVLAAGDSKTEACETLGQISGGSAATDCTVSQGGGLQGVIRLAVNLLSVVAGIIAVIALMISGLKYVTSSGDASQVSSAKRTLIYAIVGMIVAGVAQVIVRFVLAETL